MDVKALEAQLDAIELKYTPTEVVATSFEGVARNAKAGAVLVGTDQVVRYVRGLDEWPDLLDGQPVIVLGQEQKAQHVPVAQRDESGAWTAGKSGTSLDEVICDASWLPAPPWTVDFSDGSGNAHRIAAEGSSSGPVASWTFDPVRPEESSSGIYSGGEPARGAASLLDAACMWLVLLSVIESGDMHAEQRNMGTGLLRITTSAGERKLIIRQSAGMRLFQKVLGKLERRN